MKEMIVPVIMQLVGVAVIIAEIILPSGGLLSLLALAVLGYSLYLVFNTFSTSVGMLFIVVDVITVPTLIVIGLKLLAKSPVTLRTQLSSRKGVRSQLADIDHYLNKTGVALTNLRPAGTAEINGKRMDVLSRGEFIDKGSHLVVIAVTGNQIIVREK